MRVMRTSRVIRPLSCLELELGMVLVKWLRLKVAVLNVLSLLKTVKQIKRHFSASWVNLDVNCLEWLEGKGNRTFGYSSLFRSI